MDSWKPGTRVGVARNVTSERIEFYGYGVYEGKFALGEEACGITSVVARSRGATAVPRLRMDDGSIIWGSECWWGAEEEMKQRLQYMQAQGARLVQCNIADDRARFFEEEIRVAERDVKIRAALEAAMDRPLRELFIEALDTDCHRFIEVVDMKGGPEDGNTGCSVMIRLGRTDAL